MKIGFTERGDGGRNLDWIAACKNRKVDGAVIVTKTLTASCGYGMLELHNEGFPLILHATTTGWGGTPMEPHVYDYHTQLSAVQHLIQEGFPADRVVIRVDPIIPKQEGLARAEAVIRQANRMGLLEQGRLRISVLDEYTHTKTRMQSRGYTPCYPSGQFYASPGQFKAVAELLDNLNRKLGLTFETCAEPMLSKYMTTNSIRHTGCLSEEDLRRMGLPMPDKKAVNGQNRHGCLCLTCKTELLSRRHPCANQCAYCYWKD